MTARMTDGEKAVDYFCQGYNCAQSTAAAFAEYLNLDKDEVLNMLAGFGGGVGGMREMCGAVAGMVFTLSYANGTYDPKNNAAKTALYTQVRESVKDFTEKFGTTNCKELLLKAGCIPKPEPSVRNAEYYSKRPCAHFVEAAAEIAAKRIKND